MKSFYLALSISVSVTGASMLIAPKITPLIATLGLCTSVSTVLSNSQKENIDRKQKQFRVEQERLRTAHAECQRQSQQLFEQQDSLKQELAKVEQERKDLQLLRIGLEQQRQQLRSELTQQINEQLDEQFKNKYENCATELSNRFLKKESDLEAQFQKKQSELEQTLKEHQEELQRKQNQLDQDKQHLEQMLHGTYEERDRLKHWQKQLEEAGANLTNTLQAYQETIWQELEKQAEGFTANLIAERSKPLQEWQADLLAREEQIAKVIENFKDQWQQQYDQQDKHYQDWAETVTDDYNTRLANAHQFYKNYYLSATNEAFTELHDLKQPQLPPAEMYEEQPKASLVAERVLRYLYDNGLYLDFCDSYEEKGGISLYVKSKKRINKFVEYYHSIGKNLPALQALAPNCEAVPQYRILNEGFRIDFDLTGLSPQARASRARSTHIEEPLANWLEEVVRYCYHFRVNGQTRAGKSTFVNNLIGFMKRMFNKSVEVILIDPKYPMSRWSIKPKYKGLEESIIGLKEMADEVQLRLKLATEDADNGREIRDFEPVLYVLDEADMVAGEFNDPTPPVAEYLQELQLSTKKSVAHLLKQGLKVGAALKVMVCYIGQSPLCSTLGMNKNDFNHSANFFLGENIPTAIEEVALKHQWGYLKQQYRLRLERYMSAKGTDEERKYRYFALVKCPGEPAFLATLPPEGAYDKEINFAFVGAGADGSLDADNPEDISRFAKALEASIQKGFDGVEGDAGLPPDSGKIELLPWSEDADPVALVESAKARIVALILEGIDKPSEICKIIWGATVNTSAKPYNLKKGGVKKRIEFIVSEIKKNK